MLRGFREVMEKLDETPVAISFAFPVRLITGAAS